MGLFDSIRHAFNPEVQQCFDNLYRNYYKGLKAYCDGTGGTYNGYTFHKIRLSSSMSYSDMKTIYDARDVIIKLHETILQSEKMDSEYAKMDELIRKYPHAYISFCKKYLGIVIRDKQVRMPGEHKSSRQRRIENDADTRIKSLIGVYNTFDRIYSDTYRTSPKTARDLKYPDLQKLLLHQNEFAAEENRILDILTQEDINIKFDNDILDIPWRASYYKLFLKARGRAESDKKYVIEHLSELASFRTEQINKEYSRLKSLYPIGVRVYESEYSSDKENIIKNEVRLKELQVNGERFEFMRDWIRDQDNYAQFTRSINPTNFGCYSYSIEFVGVNPDGTPKNENYKIWQHFCESFYSGDDIDCSVYCPNVINNAKKIICFIGKTISYRDSIFDTILETILKIKQKYGKVTVVWGSSTLTDPVSFNDYHFSYLRSKLASQQIDNVNADDLSFPGLSRNLVILDVFTTNDWLGKFCSKIISENKELRPLITYISLCKGYDKSEVEKIISDKIKKEVEEKRQKEEAEKKRREQEERERLLQKQKERERTEILSCVSSWHSLFGRFQYTYLLNYYPTTCDFEATEDEWEDRWTVWNFKNTPGKTSSADHERALLTVLPLIKSKLISSFGSANLQKLTLVCIPASSAQKTKARYEDFSRRICSETGMTNAFDFLQVTSSSEEKKFGGQGITANNVSFNADFFRGRYVLLFDDVITKGESMLRFKRKMEELGAIVVGGMSIGKTKHNRL